MKTKKLLLLSVLTLGLTFTAFSQGTTAFTYQGRLIDSGAPANGSYDLQFTLYNTASGGNAAAGPITNSPVGVTNGLFTTMLDFGTGIFTGDARWLEIGVRTHGSETFVQLGPRQPLAPSPYALFAPMAGDLKTGASPTFTGPVTFNPAVGAPFAVGNTNKVANLHADLLDGLNATAFWQLGGNAGTTVGTDFIGTTDSQPLELRVNGARALRLEPGSGGVPNVIGGAPNNAAAADLAGVTIAGGSQNIIQTGAAHATIGGGLHNQIQSFSDFGSIGGGADNTIQSGASHASIGGGRHNTIQTDANVTTIGGGEDHLIQTNADGATIAGGTGHLIRAEAYHSTIGGGRWNTINNQADYAAIGGGQGNVIQTNADYSVIGGGSGNNIQNNAYSAVISGGVGNVIQSDAAYATIPGGANNLAMGLYSLAAGRLAHADHRGAFVWADSANDVFASTSDDEFAVRANGGFWLASHRGLRLDSWNGPLITRGWDLFGSTASWEKQGHGRWGLFMEPHALVAGIPSEDAGGSWFQVAKFDTNGTRTALMTVDQAGNVSATAFNPSSDRSAKERFARVEVREVLDKVVAMPISAWNFKEDANARHIGPMAQDFHASFGLGKDDKHVATVDADGVALAAIQGLNQKLEEKSARIAELEKRLAALEQILNNHAK